MLNTCVQTGKGLLYCDTNRNLIDLLKSDTVVVYCYKLYVMSSLRVTIHSHNLKIRLHFYDMNYLSNNIDISIMVD